jgi:hypothetical protein
MADADLDRPSVPHVTIPTRGRPLWVRGMACVAIVPLLGFIGKCSSTLWGEWASLRQEQVSVRSSAIVGYVNINPKPSFAASPPIWYRDEGEDALLWACWRDGKHHWYRLGRDDIVLAQISLPLGQDVIQAIDYPLFEQAGGECWVRIPDEAPVASFEDRGGAVAYPLKVLDKVEAVNDRLGDRPVLVAFTPGDETVSIFEATLEGHRVTMGHGGYFFKQHPVFYDRGTESLWSEREGAMVAVAGRRKGSALKLIARLETVAWGDWRARHPDGRLLIGADRSQARPVD